MGVISAADIARRRTAPAMARTDSVRLVAVAARAPQSAAAFAGRFGCEHLPDYASVLDHPDVEAVYLPLPTGLRAAWIERALRAGKHVLSEKPLAMSHDSARHLMRLARDRGLVLVENLVFPLHGQHRFVQGLLADGVIGELRGFASEFGIPPRPAGDFRHDPGLGGGALFEVGVYPLRAAQLFLGGELRLHGATLEYDDHGVDVAGAALLSSADGVSAQLGFGFRHAYRSGYTLWGSEGVLTLGRAFTPPESHRPVVRVERQDHVEEITLPADHQFVNGLELFAQAVRGGKDTQALTEISLRQAALVDAIRTGAS
ncbi:Gfo/Idh/MocA family oxidoreductase [Nonomuraea sp. NN258]|nr:Gfo/Idh/MocA family oxidoreductase [Nonomuraea antri]